MEVADDLPARNNSKQMRFYTQSLSQLASIIAEQWVWQLLVLQIKVAGAR